MHSVLLLLLVFFSFWTGGDRLFNGRSPVGLDLDLNLDLSAVFRRVDPRFLSVTIDASLASEERFMLLLRSQKIRTLAKALSPAFLRFGGTKQDFMVFSPQRSQQLDSDESCSSIRLPWWLEQRLKEDLTQQQLILLKEEQQNKYKRVHFTELTVDLLHSFSSCSGLDLIFGLNALLRTSDNSWNSSNARSLLQYCQSKQYNMSWELGNGEQLLIRVSPQTLTSGCTEVARNASVSEINTAAGQVYKDLHLTSTSSTQKGRIHAWEHCQLSSLISTEPNSYEKKAGIRVDGHQLGVDFIHLRKMLSESKLYRDSGLYGPDVGQPRGHKLDLLES
ncbi:hypothetical protein AMECASPLE_022110 [Ameca splendens]|uniref:Heparanase n=1 Tax=Ameca splendens TaxID=208324 RepID=A0ABV1AA19_9TELE